MEISLSDLKRIITTAAEIGVENYMKVRDPESDMMKQADAKRYLSKLGIQPVMLHKWADQSYLPRQDRGCPKFACHVLSC